MGRKKQVTDEVILDAARGVFVEKGYAGSTTDIAQKAGVSEAVLFQRYGTKLDLFFTSMLPPAPDIASRSADLDVHTALLDTVTEIRNYFRQVMPSLIQLASHPSFALDQLTKRNADYPLLTLYGLLSSQLEPYSKAGAVTSNKRRIETAIMTLLATLHSLALFELIGVHGGAFPDQMLQELVEFVIAGISIEKENENEA